MHDATLCRNKMEIHNKKKQKERAREPSLQFRSIKLNLNRGGAGRAWQRLLDTWMTPTSS
jgi:hypothetical protein